MGHFELNTVIISITFTQLITSSHLQQRQHQTHLPMQRLLTLSIIIIVIVVVIIIIIVIFREQCLAEAKVRTAPHLRISRRKEIMRLVIEIRFRDLIPHNYHKKHIQRKRLLCQVID